MIRQNDLHCIAWNWFVAIIDSMKTSNANEYLYESDEKSKRNKKKVFFLLSSVSGVVDK